MRWQHDYKVIKTVFPDVLNDWVYLNSNNWHVPKLPTFRATAKLIPGRKGTSRSVKIYATLAKLRKGWRDSIRRRAWLCCEKQIRQEEENEREFLEWINDHEPHYVEYNPVPRLNRFETPHRVARC